MAGSNERIAYEVFDAICQIEAEADIMVQEVNAERGLARLKAKRGIG